MTKPGPQPLSVSFESLLAAYCAADAAERRADRAARAVASIPQQIESWIGRREEGNATVTQLRRRLKRAERDLHVSTDQLARSRAVVSKLRRDLGMRPAAPPPSAHPGT